MAGERYFERGADYYARGKVTGFQDWGDSVEATVLGTEEYTVALCIESDRLAYDCDCPLGLEEEFCKHCVAVGLYWIQTQEASPGAEASSRRAGKRKSFQLSREAVAAALNARDKSELVNTLLAWADEDTKLWDKLKHQAARWSRPDAAADLAREALRKAIRVRSFVDYRQMSGYARNVDAAIEEVSALLETDGASTVMDLCEAGVEMLRGTVEKTDDSDGHMSVLMGRLEDLHYRACVKAKPDPVELARRLFQAEVASEYDEWFDCSGRYADLLGEAGMAVYRSCARTAWAQVPAIAAKGDYGAGGHYRLTRIMEAIASESGDVEDLVSVLERDLSSAHQYLRIAEAYRQAGKREKSLAWAERGMDTFPGFNGAALRRFVAEEYRNSERHADAVRLMWLDFRNTPTLQNYQALETFARAAGDWEDWRSQALGHVRKKSAGAGSTSKNGALIHRWSFDTLNRSLLVQILIYEGRNEEAWQEAQAGGCSEGLWTKLAELRQKLHPEDARDIYFRQGEQTIHHSIGDYSQAVTLLENAALMAQAHGSGAEFEARLDALLLKCKAKRNLQKRVAERKKFLYLKPAVD